MKVFVPMHLHYIFTNFSQGIRNNMHAAYSRVRIRVWFLKKNIERELKSRTCGEFLCSHSTISFSNKPALLSQTAWACIHKN